MESLTYGIFGVIAALTALSSVLVVTVRNPVTSAIFLVATLFLVACIFAMLDADFVAAIQVLVYAGAIMVLFVFVIMLLNLDTNALQGISMTAAEATVLAASLIGFGGLAVWLLGTSFPQMVAGVGGDLSRDALARVGGNTQVLGLELFTGFVWPFELASLLILLAIVASVVVARPERRVDTTAKTERKG